MSTAVPQLSPETMTTYWQQLLGMGGYDLDTLMRELRENAQSVMKGMTNETSILEATKGGDGPDNIFMQQALREEAVVRLASKEVEQSTEHALLPYLPLLESNPRAMKRMVNSYGVHRTIDILRGGLMELENLALWTIVEMRWPLLADHLSRNPQDLNIITSEKLPEDNDFSKELKSLMLSNEVQRVVLTQAPGIGKPLTIDGIKACVGSANVKTDP